MTDGISDANRHRVPDYSRDPAFGVCNYCNQPHCDCAPKRIRELEHLLSAATTYTFIRDDGLAVHASRFRWDDDSRWYVHWAGDAPKFDHLTRWQAVAKARELAEVSTR